MSEVQFYIRRKAALAGALLPYRIYINGLCVGVICNGKSLHVSVPKADVYYIEDDIFSSRNAVVYDNGLSECGILMKRAGGWRTESYNVFFMDKNETVERAPSFHWEKFFELQQTMSQSERTLALCFKFWRAVADDLEDLFASADLFDMIAALQKIGAQKYHDMLCKTVKESFRGEQLPLSEAQIEQMRPEIEIAYRAFWENISAITEFHEAAAHFLITALSDPDHVF